MMEPVYNILIFNSTVFSLSGRAYHIYIYYITAEKTFIEEDWGSFYIYIYRYLGPTSIGLIRDSQKNIVPWDYSDSGFRVLLMKRLPLEVALWIVVKTQACASTTHRHRSHFKSFRS